MIGEEEVVYKRENENTVSLVGELTFFAPDTLIAVRTCALVWSHTSSAVQAGHYAVG